MKRLLCAVAMVFVVLAPSAYADDIPLLNVNITYVEMHMGPNDGSGDNVSFLFSGLGTLITGFGGMACYDWCSGPITDTSSASVSEIFLGGFNSIRIKGTNYDPSSSGFSDSPFSMSGDVNGSSSGFFCNDTCVQANFTFPPFGVSWGLNFVPVDGGFQFVSGQFIDGTPPAPTPEPGTLGLLATGLLGIVGVIRRKGLICR
jgi:hypothetical protein